MSDNHMDEKMYNIGEKLLAYFAEYSDSIIGMILPVIQSCDHDEGTMELIFTTAGWMRNTNDTLHGGITATILDFSMGFLTMCMYDGMMKTPTANLQVSYLLPVPVDEEVLVKARLTHGGKNIAQLTAEMVGVEDASKIYATSSATFYIMQ